MAAINRRDILAAGLAGVLFVNLLFSLGYILGIFSQFEGADEYSIGYFIWAIFCFISIPYSIIWTYITAPINRWAILALLISFIVLTIFAYPYFIPGRTLPA